MAILKPSIFYAWAETGSTTDPLVPKTQLGWISEVPTFQNFNWVLNRQDVFNQHINERGVAEWDSITVYIINSIVTGSNGLTYKSLIDPNTGNDPVGDGGITDTNWSIYVQEEQFFSPGHDAVYLSIGAVQFLGVDLSSFYNISRRVLIESVSLGRVYADVLGAFYSAPDTYVTVVIDGGVPLVNETIDVWKLSTQYSDKCNLPFGLAGLADVSTAYTIPIVDNMIARKTPRQVGDSPVKVTLTKPDVQFKTYDSTIAPQQIIVEDKLFDVTITGVANNVRLRNRYTGNINFRTSLNKAAWVTTNLAIIPAWADFNLGNNGILEMQVCNLDISEPWIANVIFETDALGNVFVWNSTVHEFSLT